MVCQAFEKEFQLNIHYITSITSGKCWHLQNDLSTSSGKWHPVSGKGWHFGKVSISSCKRYHRCQEVNMHHFKLYIQAEICIKPSSIVTTGLGTGFGWVTWCFFCFFFWLVELISGTLKYSNITKGASMLSCCWEYSKGYWFDGTWLF